MNTTLKFIMVLGIVTGLVGMHNYHASRTPLEIVYAIPDGNYTNFTLEIPQPPYSYSENGVLVIDVSPNNPFYPGQGEGLSADTVYVFEKVFSIENNVSETGYESICVRISSDSDSILFFSGEFEGSWSSDLQFTINANETVHVGMRIETAGCEIGEEVSNVTIEAWGGTCG